MVPLAICGMVFRNAAGGGTSQAIGSEIAPKYRIEVSVPEFERLRVLIWGKTYPELSAKYVETVCTGGVRDDGRPIRLYPVPLRYLGSDSQYKLYDWIDVTITKSTHDPRPESFKVDADGIKRIESLDTDRGSWRRRREAIFKDTSWQFGSVAELKSRQREEQKSLGIVTPGSVEEIRLVPKSENARHEYDKKMEEVQSQKDLFRPEYKELEFLPFELRMKWRCAEHCNCSERPHDMKALDWGLLELARRDGWEKAKGRLETISNLSDYEFRLYMGNFRLHPHNFGIIGMWYPKIPEQASLL
jgi:hypothetical protein